MMRLPKVTLLLLVALVGGWILSYYYSVDLNPETRFWKGAADVKMRCSAQLDQTGAAKIVFAGDSSVMFGIDPAVLQQSFGLRSVNAGVAAGMGPKAIIGFGLLLVRPGDTLVVSIEPDLLAGKDLTEPLGVQFAFALHRQEILNWGTPTFAELPVSEKLNIFRPGGYNVFTMLGKIVLRKPLYRYSAHDLRANGWASTKERPEINSGVPPETGSGISPDVKDLLQSLAQNCNKQNIHLLFTFPYVYSDPAHLRLWQDCFRQQSEEISRIMPILENPDLGILTDRASFADSALHLTEEGAKERTEKLGQQIVSRQSWSSTAQN